MDNFNVTCMNVNGIGSKNLDKLYQIRNDFRNSDGQLLVIQEPKITEIYPEFFHVFNPAEYSVKFTPARPSQGLCSIVKKSTKYQATITDLTINKTPIHMFEFEFTGTLEKLKIMSSYCSPSDRLDEKFLQIARKERPAVLVGDMNCYMDNQFRTIRDTQLYNWMADNQFEAINDFCSWKNFSRERGPDQCLIDMNNEKILLGSKIEKGNIYCDHYGLNLTISLGTEANTTHGLKTKHRKQIYDYNLLDKNKLNSDFEALDTSASIQDIYNIWQSHLDKIGKTIPIKGTNLASIDEILMNLDNQNDLEQFFVDLAAQTSGGILSHGFQYIRFLEQAKNASEAASDKKSLKTNALASEIDNWTNYKSTVSAEPVESPATLKAYERATRWWRNSLKAKNHEYFSSEELARALSGLKNSVGSDNVRKDMFPSSTLGKKKFLFIINKIMFSSKALDRRLKSGEMFFLRKNDTEKSHKLRPITQINRFAALCDRLISSRLDKLIQADQALAKSRYGFLQQKNIDMLIGDMQEHLYKSQKEGQKMAIIYGDQSGAYDSVPHKKLVVKLFKLLKRLSPELRRKGSVCLGYIMRWLVSRRVKFRVQTVYLKIGLPQGSPLSPCVYVLFFDIENDRGRQFIFADDLIIVVTGASWPIVEKMVEASLNYTHSWCIANNANLNL